METIRLTVTKIERVCPTTRVQVTAEEFSVNGVEVKFGHPVEDRIAIGDTVEVTIAVCPRVKVDG